MRYFENHFLFSETYIKEYIKLQKNLIEKDVDHVYKTIKEYHDEYGDNWLGEYIPSAMATVGFQYVSVISHLLTLYTNNPASGDKPVAVLYAVEKDADLNSISKGRYPAYKAVSAAKQQGLDWAMLTNGYKWRIYHVNNVSPYENYLEVDIENSLKQGKAPDDAFTLFHLFFNARSYYRDESGELIIKKIKDKSDAKAEQVEDFLRGKAEEVLKDICYGLKENMGQETYDRITCRMIYQDAITLLFRMLFFGYAESRGLLPCNEQDVDYRRNSFFKLCDEAKEILNSGSAHEYTNRFEFWDRLDEHLRIYVDRTYNGGLFNNEGKHILRNHKIANGWIMKCLAEISFNKDKKTEVYTDKIEYKDLSVRNLGAIYEGLLEYNLFIAEEQMLKRTNKGKTQYLKTNGMTLKKSDEPNILEKGDIYLSQGATERKDTGAYYTPEDVVEYIVGNTVDKKLVEFRDELKERLQSCYAELAVEPTQTGRRRIQQEIDEATLAFVKDRIASVTIIDSAMGSGHFLVNAAYRLANGIVETLCSNDWENEEIPVDITYWKRKVVEHCIYGIDINGLAVTLAKLSLWLISAANDKALSFIDHHLKEGNSIVGTDRHQVKTSEQVGGIWDTSYETYMAPVVTKYEELNEIGSDSKEDVEKQKAVYAEIQDMIKLIKKKYDYYLASQYAGGITDEYQFAGLLRSQDISDFSQTDMNALWEIAAEKKFFHWELEFPEVFMHEGFDIAIGNPPYVEYRSEDYNPLVLRNKGVGNLFAPMIESTITGLGHHGVYGFIVPISIVSTERMRSLQNYVYDSSAQVSYINFAVRPAKIFRNVDMNITVFHGTKDVEGICKIYTSKYTRWHTQERHILFERIETVDSTSFKELYSIPKIGCQIEIKILEKIIQHRAKVGEYTDESAEAIYLHSGGRYWRKCLREKVSSQYIPYKFMKIYQGLFVCLFNSSFYYWYWIIMSDCYHVTKRDVLQLNIDLNTVPKSVLAEFDVLAEQLLDDYERYSDATQRTKDGMIFFEKKYYPKHSKLLIDTIDKKLAEIYGLSDEELDFIINYDIRFRMGDSEGGNDGL